MKKNIFVPFLIISLVVAICNGCQNNDQVNLESSSSTPKKFEAYYSGDITKVDYIEMISGSSGEKKIIDDQVEIKMWIENIRDLEIVSDPTQQESVGVLFHVTLYENTKKKLYLTPTTINHMPVKPNLDLTTLLKELYAVENSGPQK
ncbi:hypothetical protein JJQ72_18550 [Paenibacillus sp. F411]|uniref:hypothetical protein n=1 Tax=Paenibacillus sp. F411 TaxID=2820239 RepID=UPI001AAF9F0B|nr:hypothetical protein [Paenibacillus sp. F411]MBO2945984.1 hypothetical protein [Paenibacillus sp. F411]